MFRHREPELGLLHQRGEQLETARFETQCRRGRGRAERVLARSHFLQGQPFVRGPQGLVERRRVEERPGGDHVLHRRRHGRQQLALVELAADRCHSQELHPRVIVAVGGHVDHRDALPRQWVRELDRMSEKP